MASSRRQYPFHLIETKWQKTWDEQQAFRAFNPGESVPEGHPFGIRHDLSGKVADRKVLPPKFYILDMFPYPSGAGLHVGHPEGYTATDILARYRRACGFNVLHPMGWDSFGLPAEQYAVKTGQHPRVTTGANIANFTRQIKSLGFSYDWSRELATTDPDYFKWTQWIFLKLYNSWFNLETNKAEPISRLVYPKELELADWAKSKAPQAGDLLDAPKKLDAETLNLWNKRREYRDSKRLAYVSEAPVNWCPELGTVLANEEVIDGKSEVGGFPVIRKPMRQWMLRITAYAEKLLADLDTIDWSDSLKEMQRNWIGRSEGAEVDFVVAASRQSAADHLGKENGGALPSRRYGEGDLKIRVFTTRPDTLFGATYMVLSPEHKLLKKIIPKEWPAETPFYWKGPGKEIVGLLRPGEKHVCNWEKVYTPYSGVTPNKPVGLKAEFVSLEDWKPTAELTEEIQRQIARYKAVVLAANSSRITIAISNLDNLAAIDAITFLVKREVEVKVAAKSEIEVAIKNNFGNDYGNWSPEEAVKSYQDFAASKSDLERTELAKEKSGVFTGAYAINPVNGEKIPIWIADYVLASYGTGAIMAVPAHDTRDFEFATKFKLPIVQVVQPPNSKTDWRGFVDDGTSVNSTGPDISITGLSTPEAKKKITVWLEEKGLGKKTINYKLRDWLFSRQRYWGEPFPIIWKKDTSGNLYHEALPESALPLLPPTLEDYKPTSDGQPPLARAKEWLNLPDGSVRETNTMPQWAGSCWYYLRYLDAKNDAAFVGKDAENYWMGTKQPEWEEQFRKLYDFALNNPKNEKRFVTFGKVGDEEAKLIESQTGLKLNGFRRFIDNYAIAHILHEHGDAAMESKRGLMAVTFEDFLLIPEIVEFPDKVSPAGKTATGLDGILYEKKTNGWICYVEEVRTRHNLLATKTFYKKPAAASHAGEGLAQTSETLRHTENKFKPETTNVKPTPGVDLYVGGTEHAVLHLLYARFWHKVLFDLGFVSTPEPFFKLVNQGLILGELEFNAFYEDDGTWVSAEKLNIHSGGSSACGTYKDSGKTVLGKRLSDQEVVQKGAEYFLKSDSRIKVDARSFKMSKSRGNVVNPDDVLAEYGADAFRLYEMFMGPLQDTKPWSTRGVEGVYRFLGRVWRLFVDEKSETEFEQQETTAKTPGCQELLNLIKLNSAIKDVAATPAQLKTLHACIKKVTEDLDAMRFNTAISAMMVFVNDAINWETKPVSALRDFLILLQPFSPHLAEELWEKLSTVHSPQSTVRTGDSGLKTGDSLPYAPWPKFDPVLLVESEIEIPVQVNGKLRDVIKVSVNATAAELEALALANEKAKPYYAGKTIRKIIVVPKKLVNIAAG